MQIRKWWAILGLSIIVLNACNSKKVGLTFIVTTDVHGAFFADDPISNEPLRGSMAHVSSYLKEIRAEKEIVLLDNGDIIQGDPSAYYYNFEKTDTTHLFTSILNYLNYDAATVGNHDIESGHAVYDRIKTEMGIPWLAANCINTATEKPYFEPYTILRKHGIKIAVLGLITPRIPDWLPETIWEGMYFEDMIESASYWVPRIQEEENPDIIVGLFHSGLEYTYNGQDSDTPQNENAVRLVIRQVPGFDLVFCGHDHKTWNEFQLGPEGDSVLILGSQSRAREIARADISFERRNRKWEIVQKLGENVFVGDKIPDKDYSANFNQEFQKIKAYVNQDVAMLNTPLESGKAIFGPSEFMSLIHKVQLDIGKADISFAAPLAFNATIEPGMLKVDDLFDLYRFENLLYTMELSGQEILDYLNFSYGNWFSTMTTESDHLIRMRIDNNGNYRTTTAYYNFDSALGIDYIVDVTKPAGQQVIITKCSDGSQFKLDKKYKVAINSYRGNGGGGHLIQGAGIPKEELAKRLLASTDKDLRFYMKFWMESEKSITIMNEKNWQIVPEKLYHAGVETDQRILFRK
jgi:2',3'-cyclic-nucleotide 2'-phosphodiesterase/3'-nucleotidase